MINVARLRIPLSILTKSDTFTVVGQSLVAKYESGKATGEYDGVKLELFDALLLDRITVKVPGNSLPFEQTRVESQEVQIALVNPTFSFYIANNNQIALSIKADAFKELLKK